MLLEILFGSQTGTAEDVSERFSCMARSAGVQCRVRSLNSIQSMKDLGIYVLFIVSTTGDGEEPENMRQFWRIIMKKSLSSVPSVLSHIHYGLIGLGDSTYPKFNFVAKKLSKRLEQLGAHAICEKVLADEQHPHGIDGCIDQTFTKVFWKTFGDLIGQEFIPHIDQCLPSRYQIEWIDSREKDLSNLQSSINIPKIPTGYTSVPLISNTRVTALDHWQDVRLLEFDTNLSYKCGDVAVILPQCPLPAVHLLAKLLNVEDKLNHQFIASNETSFLSMTVLELFRDYLHITRIPSRSFFEKLVWFSNDERERERLLEFLQPESIDDLYAYCHRPRRTSVEVLQDFPLTTSSIPFNYVFDIFSPIRPRSFSIASSPKTHQSRIQLLVAVVRYKTIIALYREGLCSNYLSRLEPGENILMRIAPSFNLIDDDRPALMIGPGTGVAPFRGWILERSFNNQLLNMLFFGCRYRTKDAFIENDLLNDKINLIYIPAYSRDQEDKIYVQHKIIEYGHLVWEWIAHKQARVYLAGNAKQVPEQIADALKTVFIKDGNMTNEQADAYLREMERTKQFQRETWS
ncbi:unnamed protein product [Rotaria socialis]|uniref:NADPH-dependent diflavin oxidoreductase 1 n=1 Tax=Rotaria socialis TaxID=392032 RepID=A0A820KHT7_9BILA|nr:unnamed protein product [Rotaria socialis]CAF3346348.1 unnamed protein product [Rotaria socialis]CAF3460012.1 unnamed protein product [Rotaria socialis]CAF3464338.1 unnamed protein product [Rotaria socialis]CAF3639917.1 unnamed protein product [Rotaria socialis]